MKLFAVVSYHAMFENCRRHTPNVVVEWLTTLVRIRKVPGLNLGPEAG
jgi:hypothetical protein